MDSADDYYSSDGNFSAWDQQYWDAEDGIGENDETEDEGKQVEEDEAHDRRAHLYSAQAASSPFPGNSGYIGSLHIGTASEEGFRRISKIFNRGDNDSEHVNVSDSSNFESGSSDFSDMNSSNFQNCQFNTEDDGQGEGPGKSSSLERVSKSSGDDSKSSEAPCEMDIALSNLRKTDSLCLLDSIGSSSRLDEKEAPSVFLQKFFETYDGELPDIDSEDTEVFPGLRIFEKHRYQLKNEETLPWWKERAEKRKEYLKTCEPFYGPGDSSDTYSPKVELIDKSKYPSCAKNDWRRDPARRAFELDRLESDGISNMSIPHLMDLSVLSDLHLKVIMWYDWAEKKEATEIASTNKLIDEKKVANNYSQGKNAEPQLSGPKESKDAHLDGLDVSFLDWMETPCGRSHTPYGLATCKVCTYFTEYAKQSNASYERAEGIVAPKKTVQVDRPPTESLKLEELLNSGSRAASRVHNAQTQEYFERSMRNLYALHSVGCSLINHWREQSTSYNKDRWGSISAEGISQRGVHGYSPECFVTTGICGKIASTKQWPNVSSIKINDLVKPIDFPHSEAAGSAIQQSADIRDNSVKKHDGYSKWGKHMHQESKPVISEIRKSSLLDHKTSLRKCLRQEIEVGMQKDRTPIGIERHGEEAYSTAPEKVSRTPEKKGETFHKGMSIEFPSVVMRFRPQDLTREQSMLLERINGCLKMREKLFEKLLLIEADKLNHPSNDAAQTKTLLSRHLMATSPAALDSLILQFSELCSKCVSENENPPKKSVHSKRPTASKDAEGRKVETGKTKRMHKEDHFYSTNYTQGSHMAVKTVKFPRGFPSQETLESKEENKNKKITIMRAHTDGGFVSGGGGSLYEGVGV
ncbi:hypothetical protein RUND412_010874 [Rhizina undulata]